MRIHNTISLTIGLLTTMILQGCSGGSVGGLLKDNKNNNDSSENSGGDTQDNDTADQPTEVSGGFGLACDPSQNADNPSMADLTCYFADKDGKKLDKQNDLVLDVKIDGTSSNIKVYLNSESLTYEFSFTIFKTDAEQAFIDAKFKSSLANAMGSPFTVDKSAALTAVLTSAIPNPAIQ